MTRSQVNPVKTGGFLMMRNISKQDEQKLKVLDMFSGLGGFSQAFKDRGHVVTRVDIEERFNPDICQDVMEFNPENYYDVVLASPPCIGFSRESMPWLKTGKKPSLVLVERTKELIEIIQPKWWILENVRGSVRWISLVLGQPIRHIGSRYLWGDFPLFDAKATNGKAREAPSPDRAAKRALIPYQLSLNLCVACERDYGIPPTVKTVGILPRRNL